jgi:hypothetical protein
LRVYVYIKDIVFDTEKEYYYSDNVNMRKLNNKIVAVYHRASMLDKENGLKKEIYSMGIKQ